MLTKNEMKAAYTKSFEESLESVMGIHQRIMSGYRDDYDPYYKKLYELILSTESGITYTFLNQVVGTSFSTNINHMEMLQIFLCNAFLDDSEVTWEWKKIRDNLHEDGDYSNMYEFCEPFDPDFTRVELRYLKSDDEKVLKAKDAYEALLALIDEKERTLKSIEEFEKWDGEE